jgi:hypothetical protein
MSGAVPLLPLYAFIAWTGTIFQVKFMLQMFESKWLSRTQSFCYINVCTPKHTKECGVGNENVLRSPV